MVWHGTRIANSELPPQSFNFMSGETDEPERKTAASVAASENHATGFLPLPPAIPVVGDTSSPEYRKERQMKIPAIKVAALLRRREVMKERERELDSRIRSIEEEYRNNLDYWFELLHSVCVFPNNMSSRTEEEWDPDTIQKSVGERTEATRKQILEWVEANIGKSRMKDYDEGALYYEICDLTCFDYRRVGAEYDEDDEEFKVTPSHDLDAVLGYVDKNAEDLLRSLAH